MVEVTRRDALKLAGGGLALLPASPWLGSQQTGLLVPPATEASTKPLVPGSGTAWWGAYVGKLSNIPSFERLIGRKVAVVRVFHDWSAGQEWPTSAERSMCGRGTGRHILISQELRYFGTTRWVHCADITAGKYDGQIRAQARKIASWGVPCWYVMAHEMDDHACRTHIYTYPRQFARAWRHVHRIWQAEGATNAQWVWCVTGYRGNYSLYPGLYPGNDVVDWLAWDPYLWAWDNWQTPAQRWGQFRNWLRSGQSFIDPTKPKMLCETAVDVKRWVASPHSAADWWAASPEGATTVGLKAVCFFNRKASNGDWYINDRPAALAAYTKAGHNPVFNP